MIIWLVQYREVGNQGGWNIKVQCLHPMMHCLWFSSGGYRTNIWFLLVVIWFYPTDIFHGNGSQITDIFFCIGDSNLHSWLVFHWILLVFFGGGEGVRGYNRSYQCIRPFIEAPCHSEWTIVGAKNGLQVEYILGISVLHSIVFRFKAWPPVVPQNWVGSDASQGIHGRSVKRWSWM